MDSQPNVIATVASALAKAPVWLLGAVFVSLVVLPTLPGVGALLTGAQIREAHSVWPLAAIPLIFRLLSLLSGTIANVRLRQDQRRTLNVTVDERRSYWRTSIQTDGSVITQFALHFMAKNRTSVPHHLLRIRIINPQLRGDALADPVFLSNAQGTAYNSAKLAGNYIPAKDVLQGAATLLFAGEPKQKEGRLKTAFEIRDEDGNKMRVHCLLRNA